MYLQYLGLALLWGAVLCEPPANNQYLPPPTGYDYQKPAIPFPSATPPAYRPPQTAAPPAYRPPQTAAPPAYRPPQTAAPPAYRPPQTAAPPAYRPPQPTYGPPSPPPYRPPQPTYGTPSPPPYRPPATVAPPAYRPPATPAPPAYRPPQTAAPPAYRPPQPTYGTPAPPRPSYGPPIGGAGTSGAGVLADQDHDHHHHHEPGMPFDFNYAVKDDYYGTDYSHNAISDGDVVRGQYRVALPDGRIQIVTYTADWKNGFNADVKYEGEPRYPDQTAYKPNQVSPSYGPPPASGPY